MLRVDLEIFKQPGNPGQHEIQEHGGIRRDDPLHRGVADVPLVPSRATFSRAARALPRSTRARPQRFSDRIGFRLWAWPTTLLASGEHLLRLPRLGALQVTDLQGHFLTWRRIGPESESIRHAGPAE